MHTLISKSTSVSAILFFLALTLSLPGHAADSSSQQAPGMQDIFVSAGSACANKGALAYSQDQKMRLSCINGFWAAAEGAKPMLGFFTSANNAAKTCVYPNPVTGSCSCPSQSTPRAAIQLEAPTAARTNEVAQGKREKIYYSYCSSGTFYNGSGHDSCTFFECVSL